MGETDQPKEKRLSDFIPIDLTLRTQQMEYLEYLAERDDMPLSRALGRIIEKRIASTETEPRKPTQKFRKHFTFIKDHLSFLDRLGVKWGISRTDVARRLIDDAIAKDPTI